jgi:hypothetical protein
MRLSGGSHTFTLDDGTVIEYRVDDAQLPAVMRAFTGTTPLDAHVDALPWPEPASQRAAVWLLRCSGGLRK